MKMEYVSSYAQNHDTFNSHQDITLNKEKDSAFRPSNKRRGARRRRHSTDSDNYTVSLSRVQIYESNRVLRSKSKGDATSSLDSAEIPPSSAQTKAISNDHSYSRNSKRSTNKKEHITFSTTFHFNDLLDLTSSEENSSSYKEETFEDTESHPCEEIKIEAIDFDDLESLNFSLEDRSCACDQHSSDQSFENININIPVDQALESSANDSRSLEITASCEGSRSDEDSKEQTTCENEKKDVPAVDTDRLDDQKTACLSADALLLEEAFKMLDSVENLDLMIPKETASNVDFLQAPTYVDLDEFRKQARNQKSAYLTNQTPAPTEGTISMNVSSGGIFEWLGIAAPSTTKKRPQPDSCNLHDYRWSDVQIKFKGQKTMDEICEYLRPFETSFITNFPISWRDPQCSNFETIFGKQSESANIHSKPDLTASFQNSAYFPKINLSSTSGGCIERVMSPVIPRQPQMQKKYPGITIPSKVREIPNLTPETSQLDNLMGQQPECRIYLVDTPPPFTRTEQQTETQINPKPIDGGGLDIMKAHQSLRKSCQSRSSNKIGTTYKPKRTRRTRAQMESHRQQRACNYHHRSDRHTSRKDHRRMHSHSEDFPLTELSPRFPDFLSLPSCQYQSRHESHSVNESAHFGVSNLSPERSKSLDNNLPNSFHNTPGLKNNKSLWSLDNDNEGQNWDCPKYYEAPTVRFEENRSLHQHSAFGNVGQDLVGMQNAFGPEPMYTNLETTPFSFNPADSNNQLYNF